MREAKRIFSLFFCEKNHFLYLIVIFIHSNIKKGKKKGQRPLNSTRVFYGNSELKVIAGLILWQKGSFFNLL